MIGYVGDVVLWSGTLPDLELTHSSELVSSTDPPPSELTASAFVFVIDRSSRLLLTHVDLPGRGGWDLPGGHVDPGESLRTTAVRELREETGWLSDEDDLSVAGWNHIRITAPRPEGFHYPYPDGYMAYFVTRLPEDGRPTRPEPDSECSEASWVEPAEVLARCAERRWLPLGEALMSR